MSIFSVLYFASISFLIGNYIISVHCLPIRCRNLYYRKGRENKYFRDVPKKMMISESSTSFELSTINIRFPAFSSQINTIVSSVAELCDKWGLFSKGDISNYFGPEWLSFFDISKLPFLGTISPELNDFILNLPIYQRLLLGIASLEIIPLLLDFLILVTVYNKWNELSISNISSGKIIENKMLKEIVSKVDTQISKTYDRIEIEQFYKKYPALVFKRIYDILFIAQPFLYNLLIDRLTSSASSSSSGSDISDQKEVNQIRAKELVSAITQLGPTAIKVGQAVSVRPDFVNDIYLAELQKLQDKVQPFDSNVSVNIIESSLSSNSNIAGTKGGTIRIQDVFENAEQSFASPVASASLG